MQHYHHLFKNININNYTNHLESTTSTHKKSLIFYLYSNITVDKNRYNYPLAIKANQDNKWVFFFFIQFQFMFGFVY